MNIRIVLLLVPFLITGCSTVSNFSWSKLSPTNWFGSSLELNNAGLGAISSVTPMEEKALNQALDGDYRLRKGMGMSNGQVTSYYEAMNDDKVMLVFHGNPSNRVERIEVMDKSIETPKGSHVGMPFSDLYQKAFDVCRVGTGDESGKVLCRSPESTRITYVFSGEWMGPSEIMPSDDKLKVWTISKMVWQSK
ncbi:RpoE-regulated lipoprotein [Jinshanibacter sp. LJY008]|uniref:RpoE-regulated lipoprotein n=1 Tax=Limnobaculum eriocheiris TaxID=2897391 RepID=A0A9X1SK06_9GAMM|nr:RpoE-regulated lipoprotein [Limnobaculum eriocheiris]MCD1124759.1 RpoE-regulated lipoprotein [Limnobaculum eriocheiris]